MKNRSAYSSHTCSRVLSRVKVLKEVPVTQERRPFSKDNQIKPLHIRRVKRRCVLRYELFDIFAGQAEDKSGNSEECVSLL